MDGWYAKYVGAAGVIVGGRGGVLVGAGVREDATVIDLEMFTEGMGDTLEASSENKPDTVLRGLVVCARRGRELCDGRGVPVEKPGNKGS